MKPVRTADSNLLLTGPEGVDGILDIYAQRLEDGAIASVWWLTPDERRAIVELDANIALVIAGPSHPVVQLQVVTATGVDDDAPDRLVRLERMRDPEAG